jgi:hypothetical protein
MMRNFIDKEIAMNSFSNQATLHIGHDDNNGVDLTGLN